jgi:hypothetical protein
LHEQEVHVPAALEHVPQEPVVAVTLVEGRVGKEADPRSSGKHAAKRLRGSARVALVVSGLGRVDLQQANGRPSVSSIVSPSTTRVTTAPEPSAPAGAPPAIVAAPVCVPAGGSEPPEEWSVVLVLQEAARASRLSAATAESRPGPI